MLGDVSATLVSMVSLSDLSKNERDAGAVTLVLGSEILCACGRFGEIYTFPWHDVLP